MQEVAFACPLCHEPLQHESAAYVCERDRRSYPLILGIPDFRIVPDYLAQAEKEQPLVARLVTEYPRRSFAELVECFDSLLPVRPKNLIAKHRAHLHTNTVRGIHTLKTIRRVTTFSDSDRFLEIGCGMGGFLPVAAGVFQSVVGLDLSMPRLILAKKRLEQAEQPPILLCACAESLPLSGESFHLVVASDVIEHVQNQGRVMHEAHRVLVPGGAVFLATPNRWSLTPEPHVNVWGVGFLPMAWRERYVQLVQHVSYRGITLLNWFEIRRLLHQTRFKGWRIILPTFASEHAASLPVWARAAMPIYNLLKDHSVTKWLVCLFGPSFHVVCIKAKPSDGVKEAAK